MTSHAQRDQQADQKAAWQTNQAARDQQKNQAAYQSPTDLPDNVQPSGPKGDNPATAGAGPGRPNPSAPEDANTTPGTTAEK